MDPWTEALQLPLPCDLDEGLRFDDESGRGLEDWEVAQSSGGYLVSQPGFREDCRKVEVSELSERDRSNLKSINKEGCLRTQLVFTFTIPGDRPGISSALLRQKLFEMPKPIRQLVETTASTSVLASGNPLPSTSTSTVALRGGRGTYATGFP